MVDPNHRRLSIVRQCELVGIARSTYYYGGKGESPLNLKLMRKMGLVPIYQAPRTTVPHPAHRVYPYLLRNLEITRPNQEWCADITYIPLRRGFLYLVAIMDWATRAVLSWRLSNTMYPDFCVEALEEALSRYGRPEIFNTDQGSQFTSEEFTGVLKAVGVRISMDGRGPAGWTTCSSSVCGAL